MAFSITKQVTQYSLLTSYVGGKTDTSELQAVLESFTNGRAKYICLNIMEFRYISVDY